MKKNKKYQYYVIIDKDTNYCQGAFDLSEVGYEKAKKYLENIDKGKKKYKITKK